MDNKRLRQLAGLTETKAKTKKTAAKLNEDMDLFRKLAGLPAIVKEEDDEESEMPEDEESESEDFSKALRVFLFIASNRSSEIEADASSEMESINARKIKEDISR